MRVLSLLSFATAVLSGVSALTVPVRRSGFDSIDILEAREPVKHAIPNPIKFSGGAKAHMDKLSLVKGSAERKQVKEYHRKIIAEEMARNGAHSAQVVHLAHQIGSVDPKLHITAGFWDKDDKRMKSTYGDPPKTGQLHHVYADHHPVDPVYLAHVKAAGGTLRRSLSSEFDELEARAKHAIPNPIKLSAGVKKHLDKLGFAKGSPERKQVKEYHRRIIAAQMAQNGATSAQITHLAHSFGSVDSNFHVTAGFWDNNNKRLKTTYVDHSETPPKVKPTNLFHVYTDKAQVDPLYKAAVEKNGGVL